MEKMDSSSQQVLDDRKNQTEFQQHVVVMRHGDRIDHFEPLWVTTAARPWDTPLTESGRVRAFCTGRKLRKHLGVRIDRVLVSPFLRCIQTASEVISALCAIEDNPLEMTGDNVTIDPSKIKVSIEYGLCEALCREAIRLELVPKDGKWGFNISQVEALLPTGTVDPSVERVYQELPPWEESLMDARARYEYIIRALADKFPYENLLLVTHGEGVGIAVSAFLEDTSVYEVEYCAYSHSQRRISSSPNKEFTAGDFEVLTKNGQSGIHFCPTSALTPDV